MHEIHHRNVSDIHFHLQTNGKNVMTETSHFHPLISVAMLLKVPCKPHQ